MKIVDSVDLICNISKGGQWIGAKNKSENIIQNAKALQREIEKHCDYYENSSITINYVCSNCGYGWELDDKGVPVCCSKAQDEIAVIKQSA